MDFHIYYRGVCIESISHPANQREAEAYAKKRYSKPCVVVPVRAPKEEHAEGIARSKELVK